MAMALITHDLGVVAGLCDRVMVMYAGRVVETGTAEQLFAHPQHPYTQGLLASMPRLDSGVGAQLATIPGQPPNLQALPRAASFADRCPYVFDRCRHRAAGAARRPAPAALKACHLERPAVSAAACCSVRDLKVHFPVPAAACSAAATCR